MSHKHTRSCCFCVPVRFGVFFIAIMGLIIGLVIVISGILGERKLDDQLAQTDRTVVWMFILVYIFLIMISIYGIMAAVRQRRDLASLYLSLHLGHLLFSIGAGAAALSVVWRFDPERTVDACLDMAADPMVRIMCEQGVRTVRGLSTSLLVVLWLSKIYGCFVIHWWINDLREIEEDQAPLKDEAYNPSNY